MEILKPGAKLYLNHFINEAENEGYRGFHQFNISQENGNLMIWNKSARINVNELIKSFGTIETSLSQNGTRIVAVITKLSDVPEDLIQYKERAKDSVENLYTAIYFYNSFANSFKYQFKRFYTTVSHKTMRLLPYKILNKIKRIAGK